MYSSSYGHNAGRQLLIRRALVYSPVLFILALAECSFFAQLKFLPAVPDLIIGAIVGIAMLDSQKAAVVCGIGAGFLIDAIGASGLMLSPLFYLLCGAFCGMIAKKVLPSFLSWMVELAIFSVARSILTLLNIAYVSSEMYIADVVLYTLLPEAVCTFIICLPIYFIIKLCMVPIDSKRRLRLDKFN